MLIHERPNRLAVDLDRLVPLVDDAPPLDPFEQVDLGERGQDFGDGRHGVLVLDDDDGVANRERSTEPQPVMERDRIDGMAWCARREGRAHTRDFDVHE